MAVYRFRVSLEDNDDISRDIDIKSVQSFEQFHIAIQEAFKFDAKHAASFFVSDDYWRKNQEITLRKDDLPLEPEEIKLGVDPKKLMAETKIAKYIEQPHQRFVYIFDPVAQWSFLVEMVKIIDANPKINYPVCSRTQGTAPKQYKQIPIIKDEDLSPELGMAGLLSALEEPEEEIYKKINDEVLGVEADDLNALEGEEGEDAEEPIDSDAEEGSDDEIEPSADFDEGEDKY
jgi:Plasmid pRiA4b ORF-3-like protein